MSALPVVGEAGINPLETLAILRPISRRHAVHRLTEVFRLPP